MLPLKKFSSLMLCATVAALAGCGGSAPQATQGTATCTAAVTTPVTITATPVSGEMFIGHAALTCN